MSVPGAVLDQEINNNLKNTFSVIPQDTAKISLRSILVRPHNNHLPRSLPLRRLLLAEADDSLDGAERRRYYTTRAMSNISLPSHGGPAARRINHNAKQTNGHHSHNSNSSSRSYGIVFLILMTAIPSALMGASIATLLQWTGGSLSSGCNSPLHHESMEERIRDQLEAAQEHQVNQMADQKIRRDIEILCREQVGRSLDTHDEDEAVRAAHYELFPTMTVGRFAAAMSRIDRSEFVKLYDPGVPLDPSTDGASQVLLIYANAKVTPTSMTNYNEIPELSAREALEHCDQMHVALLDHGVRNQCLALVPQYESFHLQNWMRMSNKTGELDKTADFRLVSRGHKTNGRNEFDPPALIESRKHWKMLQQYFDSVDDVLAELRPILAKIAQHNTVVVMVVNFGQSELLLNFVCAAQSRNLDLSNIIVFTTDQEATDLANGMGLTTYFDQRVRVIIYQSACSVWVDLLLCCCCCCCCCWKLTAPLNHSQTTPPVLSTTQTM
jgi:hypothetical protein